jgi:hypothetical protein
MKQRIEQRYPAPSDVVIRMMTDRQFHCRRLELGGHKTYEVVSHKSEGDKFSIKFKRKIPMAAPGPVKKFVSAENTIVHEDAWNRATKKGTIAVEIQGMPIEISAKTSLRDDGAECVLTYDFEITSKIPLVGGAIERAVASENEKAIPEQTRLGLQLLKDYR